MLVQQPDLPLFSIVGEYYSSCSTPSNTTKQTTTNPSAAFLSLPLSVAVLANRHSHHQLTLNRLLAGERHTTATASPPSLSAAAAEKPTTGPQGCIKPPTPSSDSMPRQPQLKVVNHESQNGGAFPASPPAPCLPGGKRNSQALAGNTTTTHQTMVPPPSAGATMDPSDQLPMRLPPKLKEAERMMHVQRWVNHLSWPAADTNSTACPTHWGYCNTPGYCHTDEDREHTPPPSRKYLSRLPFTTEEEQTMLRFFTTSQNNATNEFRNANPSAAVNNAPCPSHNVPYHAQRTNALHQDTANLRTGVVVTPAQTPNHPNGDASHQHPQAAFIVDKKATAPRHLVENETTGGGGSRFFAEWETRLISHMFQEYFPGRPEPMGNSGVLPSTGEVRSRIASSRLNDLRTAVAVRAKIRRMQASGTWFEYQ